MSVGWSSTGEVSGREAGAMNAVARCQNGARVTYTPSRSDPRTERTWLMTPSDKSHALDHLILVLFENRSFDNVLGHLYGPDDGKSFEGVIGKNLSNPIPEWAEHGAERKLVPYTVATDLDSP